MLGFISSVTSLLGLNGFVAVVLMYWFCYIFAALLWHVWLWWNYCLNASWKVCICHIILDSFSFMLHELVLFLLCNRIAIVSSKTKESKKVFTLHLSKEALLKNPSSKNSEHTWKVSVSLQFLLFCYCTCCKLQSRLDRYPLDCRLLVDLGIHLKRRSCCHHIKVLPRWTTFWISGVLKQCHALNMFSKEIVAIIQS